MDAIPNELAAAALEARERLTSGARRIAATTGADGPAPRLMAATARASVFADALLAAVHARLEALKGVTK